MIDKRSYLGIPLARRSTRRWLVIGTWVLMLLLVAYFPALLRIRPVNFGYSGGWAFGIGLLVVNLLSAKSGRGIVRDFDLRSSEEGPADYSFMTPEDIVARKEAERHNRLDEREVKARNAAHYRAFTVLRWTGSVLVFAAIADQSPSFVDMRESLLLLFFLLTQWLPQSLILWTEPDMEDQP
jgi:hypothetical protein